MRRPELARKLQFTFEQINRNDHACVREAPALHDIQPNTTSAKNGDGIPGTNVRGAHGGGKSCDDTAADERGFVEWNIGTHTNRRASRHSDVFAKATNVTEQGQRCAALTMNARGLRRGRSFTQILTSAE